jgi:hypothetical protein
MLSARLVQMIEDHAEQLTEGVIKDLQANPRTSHLHHLSREELHQRTYNVYRNLGHWVSYKTDEAIEASYTDLAERRFAEGLPLSEVVYALILIKYHLRDYIASAGLMDSAVEMHQEKELRRLVGHFFDRAIYYTVRGYEREAGLARATGAVKRAA